MKPVTSKIWDNVVLGEIVTLHYGKALPVSQRDPNGQIPIYGANGIKDTTDRYHAIGPSLIIGRKGSAGQIVRVDGQFWPLDVTYFTSHDKSRVDFDFLCYTLKNLELPNLARGVKPGINRNEVYALRVPLPPMEEQRRIVAILDRTFDSLDRAICLTEANLRDSQQLLGIQFEHELSQIDGTATQTTISEVCSHFEYGTSNKSKPDGLVPVLRMGNIKNGEIDWSNLAYTDDVNDINKLNLHPFDILFNRTNSLEHVGKTAIYRAERQAIFAGYLIRLHYRRELIHPEYLNMYLNSSGTRQYGRSISGKSVNQANISASKLKTYPIMLPDLRKQGEIVERIRKLQLALREFEQSIYGKLRDLDDLRQSILQRALVGELTCT